MKKVSITLIFLFFTLLAFSDNNTVNTKPPVNKQTEVPSSMNYTGSLYEGNYVWGGAMNLAWNELSDNVIKSRIKLKTTDPFALATLRKLNSPVITKKDMDQKSYYIKSGFGPQTIAEINRECKRKFPAKSFPGLSSDGISAYDIISYAYFFKQLSYLVPFESDVVRFNGKLVKGFWSDHDSIKNVDVINYIDDDHFLLRLRLQNLSQSKSNTKDDKITNQNQDSYQYDQLLLAKGYPMDTPDSVVTAIRKYVPATNDPSHDFSDRIAGDLDFMAPELDLSMSREYAEMIKKSLINTGFQSYYIAKMVENIKFKMDDMGVKVENEACMIVQYGCDESFKIHRYLYLNKPYWIVMKRYNSNNPYFILGINNTNLMTLVDDPESDEMPEEGYDR